MKYLSVAILLTAVSLHCFGQAQAPVVGQPGAPKTRSIEGAVLNTGGSPVPGAVVLLKDTKTLQIRSYIAQQDGKYHFFGLSADVNWQLRAEANGMTSKIKTVSVFDSHTKVVLNLKLKKKIKF
ncbi:MAG: carboxypeptidase-like regulatory domain-containing protein [Bryobacteraceae bacterium]